MPRIPAPVYLDEDVSVVVAAIPRARGFEAVTTRDAGQLGRSDFQQLAFGADRSHAGIVIARRRPPGDLAARVGRLLTRLAAEDLKNQILYV